MELRKFFGTSGKVYYVTWSKETHWHAFAETNAGLVQVVAKDAAIDCGATGNPRDTNTHQFWQQLWVQKAAA